MFLQYSNDHAHDCHEIIVYLILLNDRAFNVSIKLCFMVSVQLYWVFGVLRDISQLRRCFAWYPSCARREVSGLAL